MRLSCLLKSLLQSFHGDGNLAGRKTFKVDCSRLISSMSLFVNGLMFILFFFSNSFFSSFFSIPKKFNWKKVKSLFPFLNFKG